MEQWIEHPVNNGPWPPEPVLFDMKHSPDRLSMFIHVLVRVLWLTNHANGTYIQR